MMRSGGRIWIAASLTLLLPGLAAGSSAGSLWGEENSMDRYRNYTEKWASEWTLPKMMPVDASMLGAAAGRMTDLDIASFLSTPFENNFYGPAFTKFSRQWWFISGIVVGLYFVGISAGERYMKDRKPFDLKPLLNAWNLFLAVFSFIGAIRTVPHLLYSISTFGIEYTVCRCAGVAYGSGSVGFWTMLFIYSKYFELIDTVFLVLRKRKVSFLHWYHHMTVLMYCWHSYMWEMPTGLYFTAMNYSVHAVMYFYYFLAGLGKPPPWSLFVTIIQITQMIIGIMVTVYHILWMQRIPFCDGYIWNLTLALGMYGSYFALFAEFFVSKYCKKKTKKEEKTVDAKKAD